MSNQAESDMPSHHRVVVQTNLSPRFVRGLGALPAPSEPGSTSMVVPAEALPQLLGRLANLAIVPARVDPLGRTEGDLR